MYGIFTYIGIILNYFRGQFFGKYSSTMDPMGFVKHVQQFPTSNMAMEHIPFIDDLPSEPPLSWKFSSHLEWRVPTRSLYPSMISSWKNPKKTSYNHHAFCCFNHYKITIKSPACPSQPRFRMREAAEAQGQKRSTLQRQAIQWYKRAAKQGEPIAVTWMCDLMDGMDDLKLWLDGDLKLRYVEINHVFFVWGQNWFGS